MKKKLFFLLAMFFAFSTFFTVKAELVEIPDPNFRNRLKQLYPSCFTGELMETTCSSVINATSLDVSSRGISSLAGIQYFVRLTQLYCYDNHLKTLPILPNTLTHLECGDNPELSSLPDVLPGSLSILWCYNNSLSSLPSLPGSLVQLSCFDNKLKSLPALPSGLKYLQCGNNPELNNFPELPGSLLSFECNNNQLTSLPPLPVSLKELFCFSNQLTSLPPLPPSLFSLHCYQNQLSSLPPLPNTLCYLECHNNQITCLPNRPTCSNFTSTCGITECSSNNNLVTIPDENFRAYLKGTYPSCFVGELMDPNCSEILAVTSFNDNIAPRNVVDLTGIEYFVNLEQLYMENNNLSYIKAFPSKLEDIYISNTSLTSLPVLPNSLLYFGCENSKLTQLPSLPSSLLYLGCSHNNLSQLPELPAQLQYLDCAGMNLSSLPVLPGGLLNLNCSDNSISVLPQLPNSLRYLHCSGNNINCLPNLPPFQHFYSSCGTAVCIPEGYYLIPDVNFRNWLKDYYPSCFLGEFINTSCSEVVNEEYLSVYAHGISDLTGIGLFVNLKTLHCGGNALSVLPDLPATLTDLQCSSSSLSSLPELPAGLVSLVCSYCNLTTLPKLPGNLEHLNCVGNKLTSLPQLPSTLKSIGAHSNQLTSLPELPVSLNNIYLTGNKISQLPSLPPNLHLLECSGNLLTNIPELPSSLRILGIAQNNISSLPKLTDHLEFINCKDNSISSLPDLPPTLTEIDIRNNQIQNLPLLPDGLCKLQCDGNLITCLPNIPGCPTFTSSCGNNLCNQFITSQVNQQTFCPYTTLSVKFNISGTFNSGNIFTAQLSDASGSFASPLVIGTLSSTTSGTINYTIPNNIPPGYNYRVRVVSSSPAVIGSDNGADIIIYPAVHSLFINGPYEICSTNLTGQYFVTFTPGSVYTWGVNKGGSIISGQGTASATIAFGAEGGTVNVTETNSNGCNSNTSYKHVFVVATPNTSAISGPSSVCRQSSANFSVENTSGSVYQWTVPAGATVTSGQGTSAVTVLFGTSAGNVTVKETNSAGCQSAIISKAINLLSLPAAPNISGSTSVCANTQNVLYSSTPYEGSTYYWTVNDGLTIASYPAFNNVRVNFGTTPGVIKLRRANANGCLSPESVVNVEVKPQPEVSLNASQAEVCAGTTINLTASGASTYSWTSISGLSVNGSDRSLATAKVNTSTTYTVTGTAENGCRNQATVYVLANPLPSLVVDPSNPVICRGSSVTLNADGAQNYTWTGGALAGVTESTVTVNPTSTTNYMVTGTSDKGCVRNLTVKVTVSNVAAPKINIDCNSLTSSVAGLSYQWNLEGSPIAGANSVQYNPVNCGNHTVTAINQYGCSATSAPYFVVGTGNNASSARIADFTNNISGEEIIIYPNPNNGSFAIKADAKLVVTDATGLVVYERIVKDLSELENVELGNVAQGTYLVQLLIGEHVVSKRVMVY
ncbi:MAG: T9SS type A sorting domain-containing protein [Cytophagaceae bacterium]